MTESQKQPRLETPSPEQMFGIAKRVTLDLEKFPLHSHAAIARLILTMVEHRKIVLEEEVQRTQQAANDAAMADAIQAHAKRIAEMQAVDKAAREAHDLGIGAELAKAPRSRIEIVGGKAVEDVGQRNATLPAGPDNPVAVPDAAGTTEDLTPELQTCGDA